MSWARSLLNRGREHNDRGDDAVKEDEGEAALEEGNEGGGVFPGL